MPRLVRVDCGTENSSLAFIQPFLRRNHGDCYAGFESFRYGKSVTNQVSWKSLTSHHNERQRQLILIITENRGLVVPVAKVVYSLVAGVF